MPRGDSASSQQRAARTLSAEQFVWFAGSICTLHGIAFDAELLRRRVAPPFDEDVFVSTLRELGFDVSAAESGARIETPAMAFLALAEGEQAWPVLIVRAGEDQIVFFRALDRSASTLPQSEFELRRRGPLLSLRPRTPEPRDADSAAQRPRFGFRWFVPELLKHKRIWRDVLAASAAIQLLALRMPLMTQAVIDKVVVHRTESTLIALGVVLAIFLLFSSVFTWIRQRLILHTGMRIDAVLSSAVFRHLVALPPRYFQHRPTGVIAARLHGVEQIREFLASAAISARAAP